MTAENKRRFKRIPFQANVAIRFQDSTQKHEATLEDISLKGALIHLHDFNQTLDVRQACDVVITPADAEFIIKFTAEAIYLQPKTQSIGVNILSMDIESAGYLRRLIEVNLGSDQSLKRELSSLIEAVENENDLT